MKVLPIAIVVFSLIQSPFVYGETTGSMTSNRSSSASATNNAPAGAVATPPAGSGTSNRKSSEQINAENEEKRKAESQFTSAGDAGTGAYEQAQKAQDKGNQIAMIGAAIAGAALPQCGPHNKFACILGAAGIAVAMMGMKKSKEAGKLKDNLGTLGEDSSELGSAAVDKADDAAAVQTAKTTDAINTGKGTLAGEGYGVNADGSISLPNGETLGEGDFNSQTLQSKAGLSPAQASKVLAGLAEAEKDIEEEQTIVASSTSGGGSSGGKGGRSLGLSAFDDEDQETGTGIESTQLDKDRDPASWDGFFKQRGEDKVGVSGSDLFRMVELRVGSERKVMGQ